MINAIVERGEGTCPVINEEPRGTGEKTKKSREPKSANQKQLGPKGPLTKKSLEKEKSLR